MQAEKQRTQQNTEAAAARPAQAAKLAQTAKPAQTGKAIQAPKPRKKISGGAVLAIFLVVVIIAAAALVYLNVGGLRQKAVALLQAGQTAEGEAEAISADELEQKQRELDAQAADLAAEADKLKQKSQQLSDKEKTLTGRETELITREEAVAGAEADAQQAQAAQDDLAATAKIFEEMAPAVAATAISGLDSVDDMVLLLLKMPSKTAAAVVSNMEAKLATKVLSEMMK